MKDKINKALLLLANAIERVVVNTYLEQGQAGADEVFNILEEVEKLCENEEKDSYRKLSKLDPCDMCKFNPPSSGDGKPCNVCPAQAKGGE